MNILIPHSWLKEYLEVQLNPEKIAECLSLCGTSVEKINKVDNDFIYDIEVTTNRADMMSILGIAREAAAILPQFGIKARLKRKSSTLNQNKYDSGLPCTDLRSGTRAKLKVIIKNPKLCPRFTAVILDNIKIKPSLKIIQERLIKAGMRPLNNIIDISNYLMHELGQPIHVFDYEKISKKVMILRESKKGEKLTTLDNKTHNLPGGDIVIEDGDGRLIDLCGIMGGKNSSVDQKTKRILLFVQNYEPFHIRKTSMALGQRTEAATLFEKEIDSEIVMPTLLNGIKLIKQNALAKVASKIIDIYPMPYKPKTVKISLQLIKQYLGVDISAKKAISILNSLGFKTQLDVKRCHLDAEIPSWRAKDINIPEDLIEEIARIYGYYRLPSILMDTSIPTNYPEERFEQEHQIKEHLAGMGLAELYTNSLISKNLAEASKIDLVNHLKIKNALSEKWLYLRRSIIPSHLEVIKNNPNEENLCFFEMANVYRPKKRDLPNEEFQLLISTNQNYLNLKGIVELLCQKIYLKPEFINAKKLSLNIWIENRVAEIIINKQSIGLIGTIRLTQDYPYKEVNVAQIKLRKLLKLAKIYPQYKPVAKYPPIIEDLTFVINKEVYYYQLVQLIQSINSIIQSVNYIGKFKDSLTFKIIYQDPKKNLTDKEVGKIRKKIIAKLKKQNIILKGRV